MSAKPRLTKKDFRAFVGGLGMGSLLLLINGVVLHVFFDQRAASCKSTSPQARCVAWQFGDGMAGILTWVGGGLLAGVLLGIVYVAAQRQQG